MKTKILKLTIFIFLAIFSDLNAKDNKSSKNATINQISNTVDNGNQFREIEKPLDNHLEKLYKENGKEIPDKETIRLVKEANNSLIRSIVDSFKVMLDETHIKYNEKSRNLFLQLDILNLKKKAKNVEHKLKALASRMNNKSVRMQNKYPLIIKRFERELKGEKTTTNDKYKDFTIITKASSYIKMSKLLKGSYIPTYQKLLKIADDQKDQATKNAIIFQTVEWGDKVHSEIKSEKIINDKINKIIKAAKNKSISNK